MQRWQSQLTSSASAFWWQRSRREQYLLMLTAALGIAALVFLLLIDPALSGRQQWQARLPSLRRQAAELQQLLTAEAAPANTIVAPDKPLSRATLDTLLQQHGLSSKSMVLAADGAKIEFAAASFASVIAFLQELRKAENLQVREAQVNASSRPGLVDASITLKRSKRQ